MVGEGVVVGDTGSGAVVGVDTGGGDVVDVVGGAVVGVDTGSNEVGGTVVGVDTGSNEVSGAVVGSDTGEVGSVVVRVGLNEGNSVGEFDGRKDGV